MRQVTHPRKKIVADLCTVFVTRMGGFGALNLKGNELNRAHSSQGSATNYSSSRSFVPQLKDDLVEVEKFSLRVDLLKFAQIFSFTPFSQH